MRPRQRRRILRTTTSRATTTQLTDESVADSRPDVRSRRHGAPRRRYIRGVLLAAAVLPLFAGALSVAPAQATPMPTAAAVSSHPDRLTPTQALARAKSTGKPVVVDSLTTPSSQTTVSPSGEFTDVQTLRPSRVWRSGQWHDLDAALHVAPDRRLAPAATTNGITLSDGGNTALAILTAAGQSMTLSWPAALPVPTINDETATYANVFPGVDLEVTVSPQGGFSDVLMVHNAAAAANPALRQIRLGVSAPGLHVTRNAAGGISVAANAKAQPVFTSPTPRQWDSAAPPAGTPTVTMADGSIVVRPSGLPAYSSVSGPGAAARVFHPAVSVSDTAITIRPTQAGLTAPGVRFPAYIDPSFIADPVAGGAAHWNQVDSGLATDNLDTTNELQVGDCPESCGSPSIGHVRTLLLMPVSTELATTSVVDSATLSMDDVWGENGCTKEPTQLWTTGSFNGSTTWSNQPSWLTEVQQQSFTFGGGSACGSFANDVTWTVTSVIQADAGTKTGQDFGMKAANETDTAQWKQFDSGSRNITLSTSFHSVPSTPTNLVNSPAGPCATSSARPDGIGNDDVTLSATVGDIDNANGDSTLNTTFTLVNVGSGTTAYSIAVQSGNQAGGSTVSTVIPRATMQGLNTNGATQAYTYSWTATTADTASSPLTSPSSETCYFVYNPTGSAAPIAEVAGSETAAQSPVGSTPQFTILPPSGCGQTGAPACPTAYTYQYGLSAPVTVEVNGDTILHRYVGTLAVSQFGSVPLTVYGLVNGVPGPSDTVVVDGLAPAADYSDGYFAGGSFPSLLTQDTASNDPSLWLSVGTGNGTLAPPIDIGSQGTGINPGTDGPADWAGATVLHGDFTGRGLQDVVAYYKNTGVGEILGGPGAAASLSPSAQAVGQIKSTALVDNTWSPTDVPTKLVAAGDASETCSGLDDLIGITGDATTGYVLDLFTTANPFGFGEPAGYGFDRRLGTTTAPDGTADWINYTLATAQPADSADQTGCSTGGSASDPNNVELFALDNATGAIYESTNPSLSGDSPVGSGNWTTLTAPWGTTAPSLVSADVNNAGSVELWSLAGGIATPYTLSGTTLTKEGSGSAVKLPSDDLQLSDGAANPGATTAIDAITGTNATLVGGANYTQDPSFGSVVSFDGDTGYLTPAADLVTATDPTISLWFKTSIASGSDGVLASLQSGALPSPSNPDTTTPSGYDPALYVGTDGKLRGEWYQGSSSSPITSTNPVTDGLWHHVVLSTSGTTQTMTLDGVPQGTLSGTLAVSSLTNMAFGGGFISAHWPAQTHPNDTGVFTYFAGDLADITYSQ